jgi:hypothetical protein
MNSQSSVSMTLELDNVTSRTGELATAAMVGF